MLFSQDDACCNQDYMALTRALNTRREYRQVRINKRQENIQAYFTLHLNRRSQYCHSPLPYPSLSATSPSLSILNYDLAQGRKVQ